MTIISRLPVLEGFPWLPATSWRNRSATAPSRCFRYRPAFGCKYWCRSPESSVHDAAPPRIAIRPRSAMGCEHRCLASAFRSFRRRAGDPAAPHLPAWDRKPGTTGDRPPRAFRFAHRWRKISFEKARLLPYRAAGELQRRAQRGNRS
jgi:hypothetical protein